MDLTSLGRSGRASWREVEFELRFEESVSMKKMERKEGNSLRPVYSKVPNRYTRGLTTVMA